MPNLPLEVELVLTLFNNAKVHVDNQKKLSGMNQQHYPSQLPEFENNLARFIRSKIGYNILRSPEGSVIGIGYDNLDNTYRFLTLCDLKVPLDKLLFDSKTFIPPKSVILVPKSAILLSNRSTNTVLTPGSEAEIRFMRYSPLILPKKFNSASSYTVPEGLENQIHSLHTYL